MDNASSHLASNLRLLRDARGISQAQLAKLAGVPRPTVANLESGDANPTLSVSVRMATALGISIEELISAPRATAKHYPKDSLLTRLRGTVEVRKLLPEKLPSLEMDRMQLPVRARMVGAPHTPGTREFLACETGEVELVASGEAYRLFPGDVVAFRGDQPHLYRNVGTRVAVAYSVIALAPGSG